MMCASEYHVLCVCMLTGVYVCCVFVCTSACECFVCIVWSVEGGGVGSEVLWVVCVVVFCILGMGYLA